MPLTAGSEGSWRILRLMRADPPGAATRGHRRWTFDAALGQSEQLWVASATVGPAASPIIRTRATLRRKRATGGPSPP